jgi:hypothetical protein
LKLVEGKWLLGVELVSTTLEHRSLRILAGTGSPEPLLRRPRSRTSVREELESEGSLRKESVTHRNSARDY